MYSGHIRAYHFTQTNIQSKEGLQIDGFDAQNMFRNNQFTIKPFLSYYKYWAFCISHYLTFDRQFILEMK